MHPALEQNAERSRHGRVMAICTMRNEGPFILEWVAHCIAVGFTDIAVAFNECTDGTAELLGHLASDGWINLLPNNENQRKGAPQPAAYRKAAKRPEFEAANWVLAIDADEFLHVHLPGGDVNALLDALPAETALLSLNWRMFGNAGHTNFEDALMSERFTRCGEASTVSPQNPIKTLFRPEKVKFSSISPHRPRIIFETDPSALPDYFWVDGSGNPAPSDVYQKGWKIDGGFGLAQINHYAVRDNQSFLAKRWKGRASNSRVLGTKYWNSLNLNTVRHSPSPQIEARKKEVIAAMRSRRRIRVTHHHAVNAHRMMCEQLMQDADFHTLYVTLNSATEEMRASWSEAGAL